jgi:hypothetical protein
LYLKMADLKEQLGCKYYFKLGKNAIQTSEMLKVAVGEYTL